MVSSDRAFAVLPLGLWAKKRTRRQQNFFLIAETLKACARRLGLARDVISTGMRPRRFSAKGRHMRVSFWSANNPAIWKTVKGIRSSDLRAVCSTRLLLKRAFHGTRYTSPTPSNILDGSSGAKDACIKNLRGGKSWLVSPGSNRKWNRFIRSYLYALAPPPLNPFSAGLCRSAKPGENSSTGNVAKRYLSRSIPPRFSGSEKKANEKKNTAGSSPTCG